MGTTFVGAAFWTGRPYVAKRMDVRAAIFCPRSVEIAPEGAPTSAAPISRAQATLLTAALVLVAPIGSRAQDVFAELEIDVGFRVEQPVLTAQFADGSGHDLVFAGQNDEYEQWLAVYRLTEASEPRASQVFEMKAEPELLYFDVGRVGGQTGLYFLSPGKILRYDFANDMIIEVVQIQSIYRQNRDENLVHHDFFRDIDDDGRDDLIVPDLEGLRVRLQTADGELGDEMLLPDGVQMNLRGNSVRYSNRPTYTADMNFDGLVDLVVAHDRAFHVHVQDNSRRFRDDPLIVPITLEIPTEAELRALDDSSGAVDQSELTVKRISSIRDLNDDGLLDIITDATYSEGVFDKRNEFRIHLGRREGDSLVFDDAEDSLLPSDGLQFEVRKSDINGDGKQDLIIPSVRLSFTRVMAALFSGKVSLNLRFYKMAPDDQYPKDANYETKAKVRFSMTSGQVDIPAIEVADFNGDGLEDLLIQTNRSRATLYRGEASERLFVKKGIDADIPLPRNGELVKGKDVNGDGKTDLTIRYSDADGEEKLGTVRIMLAQ